MNILFLHQNFPGQFKHIANTLVAEGEHRVLAIANETAASLPNVETIRYKLSRANTKGIHQYLVTAETHIVRGQAVARALIALKQNNIRPDIIFAHVGWGEGLFVKDIFPDVPLITYFEFFYRATGADVGFEPMIATDLDGRLRVRAKNFSNLIMLDASDAGISPTKWQKSLYPEVYQPKIHLIHEGVDTEQAKPNPKASVKINDQLTLTAKDEVITYVGRNLEPYRGFHQLMRAVALINQKRPKAHIIIVGSDGVSYGKKLPEGESYKSQLLQELDINLTQVHFMGALAYQDYLSVLQISSAHIYLTIPFVLSWSMLEAMSVGCVLLGSNTPPVMEVIEDGHNGIIVDYFSPDDIANKAIDALKNRKKLSKLRENARKTVLGKYTTKAGIEQYKTLITQYT